MVSNTQNIEIAQAVLAISNAVDELLKALTALAPSQDQRFLSHLEESAKARDECLEHLKALVALMDKRLE